MQNSRKRSVGTSVYRVVAPEFHNDYETMTKRVFAGERVKCEFQIVSFKGKQRWLETHAAPLRDQAGNVTCLLGITRDISDLKRYEDEVRLHYNELSISSRLSSMGQMATALAHQLNQPLAAIANYSRGCLYCLEAGERTTEVKVAIEHVCAQAERAGDIIASVRRFLSKGKPAFRTVNLQLLLLDALRIVAPEAFVRRIRIVSTPCPAEAFVLADRIQIEQVILNIVRNALEAMETEQAPERILSIQIDIVDDGIVQMAFKDSGPVCGSVDVEKFFEPFFTTKSMGMGMGLPICRSIIEAHRGDMDVRSNAPQHGMTFIVGFLSWRMQKIMLADEFVFVVDDDEAARNSLVWLLSSVKYQVLCYASANAFLEGYDGRPGCLILEICVYARVERARASARGAETSMAARLYCCYGAWRRSDGRYRNAKRRRRFSAEAF